MGLGTQSPDGFFHISTAGAVTAKVLTLQNTSGLTHVFRSNATPQNAITADGAGDLALTTAGAFVSGGANNNTWRELGQVLKASATLDFPSTSNHENSDLTLTVTGAVVGDPVTVSPATAAISNNSCYTAWVSATDTVTVRFNHYGTAGSIDPASGTFKVVVHKY